jgi:hypothetical protein
MGKVVLPTHKSDTKHHLAHHTASQWLKFYDLLGKEALTKTANGKIGINTSNLPKGVYTVRVFSDGKIIGNSKIVKQ